ncbi:MAG TPA: hypothetical protein VNW15_10440 [Rhizomicrobium sp.]|nr:hypothetical protein [Rhizomicrobium sp.]
MKFIRPSFQSVILASGLILFLAAALLRHGWAADAAHIAGHVSRIAGHAKGAAAGNGSSENGNAEGLAVALEIHIRPHIFAMQGRAGRIRTGLQVA